MMDVSVPLSTREETGQPMYIFHVRSHTYTVHASLWMIMLITGQYRFINYSTGESANEIKPTFVSLLLCSCLFLLPTIHHPGCHVLYILLHATLISADLQDEDFMELQEELMEAAGAHGVLLTQQREFHLSVSQTVVLKHHWIQPFTQSLKAGLASCKRLGGGELFSVPS